MLNETFSVIFKHRAFFFTWSFSLIVFLSLFFRGHRSRAPKKKELKEDDEDGFDEMEEAIEAANAADLAEIEAETAKKPKRYFFHFEYLS